jgi:hypothetical protein
MTHYKNLRPTLIPWIDWSLHPQTTARHFLTTMQASGHVGDVTLVEVVFINFVNQGWVVSQGDLHRNPGAWLIRRAALFICLYLFVFPQENKVHSVTLSLRRSLFAQFWNLWSTLIPSAMQPHGRGGAKPEEDPVANALKPEACLPLLRSSGRRAMPTSPDGCQCDPGPSCIKQRRAGLGCPWFFMDWFVCSSAAPVPRRQREVHPVWV